MKTTNTSNYLASREQAEAEIAGIAEALDGDVIALARLVSAARAYLASRDADVTSVDGILHARNALRDALDGLPRDDETPARPIVAPSDDVWIGFVAQSGDFYALRALRANTLNCLHDAAFLALVLPLDSLLTLSAPEGGDDDPMVRWVVVLTTEVRDACRALLIAEQTERLHSVGWDRTTEGRVEI